MDEAPWRRCKTCGKLWPERTRRKPSSEITCGGCVPILEVLIQQNKTPLDREALRIAERTFRTHLAAQRRAEREILRKENEERLRAEEEVRLLEEARRREELLNNPLAGKIFKGLDNWRYD